MKPLPCSGLFAQEMNMHPSWAIGIIFVMAFIVALVLGCFLLCAFLITRRRKQQVASPEPAWQASARTVLPAEETNPEDVQIHGCDRGKVVRCH